MRIDPGHLRVNVEAYLEEDGGKIVPDSYRCGHNVMTAWGWGWLSKLIAFQAISSTPAVDDVFAEVMRIRMIEVGTGRWPETSDVIAIRNPVMVTPPAYYHLVDPDGHPVPSSARFVCQFSKAQLPGDPIISEAGLITDYYDPPHGIWGFRSPWTVPDYPLATYKTFDPPLQKITGVHFLTVRWEFRF